MKPNKKKHLTYQDEGDLETLDECYGELIEKYVEEACFYLSRNMHMIFKYISHEIYIDPNDEAYIYLRFRVNTLEDELNIPFFILDDFNVYADKPPREEIDVLDKEAGIDKLPGDKWDKNKIILRFAYWIWTEVKAWL